VSTLVMTPPARRRRIRRAIGACLSWAFFGFVTVVVAFLVLPPLTGRHNFAILSGSMTPTLDVGDLVIEHPVRPTKIRVGDIVTFRDPDNPKRLLTHRVVRYHVTPVQVDVVTRGDANHTFEWWSIPTSGTVGVVQFRVPKAGYVLMHGGGSVGRVAVVLIPALLLGLCELWRIWFPKRGSDA
jgi:signal peptidase I